MQNILYKSKKSYIESDFYGGIINVSKRCRTVYYQEEKI